MTKLGFYNNERRLEEGIYYTFRFIKVAELEDCKSYIVLEDIFGVRHFIEYECYKHYELQEKSEITCLVDKINCTGRIFLEPLHPIYTLGGIYSFDVLDTLDTENGLVVTVRDCYNNLVNITISQAEISLPLGFTSICAKIENIKKGVPELIFDSAEKIMDGLLVIT